MPEGRLVAIDAGALLESRRNLLIVRVFGGEGMNRWLRCVLPRLVVGFGLGFAGTLVQASDPREAPLMQGSYFSPMGTWRKALDNSEFDDGYGGVGLFGFRRGTWAVEAGPLYQKLSTNSDGKARLVGFTLNGLLFPFASLPNLYGTIGGGASEVKNYPNFTGAFPVVHVDAGAGYVFPMQWGSYEFGIRAEARYQYGTRKERLNAERNDVPAPHDFNSALVNVGLYLPLATKAKAPPPEPVATAVVPPAAPCADGQDNDGDGKVDFPVDPGCNAADDVDEVDPPACSNGKDDDGDGLTDFPADKGCSSAEDPDETDPCKTPAPGERITLKGCGTGDVIVLRGVSFEFDRSKLTVNAKTILDNVSEELTAYPEIRVEVSGHTDARGSDEYNQRLSEQRAAAVVAYLATKGVSEDRMAAVGYGESRPVADNESDEGRELNRRVELRITAGVAGTAAGAREPAAADESGMTPES